MDFTRSTGTLGGTGTGLFSSSTGSTTNPSFSFGTTSATPSFGTASASTPLFGGSSITPSTSGTSIFGNPSSTTTGQTSGSSLFPQSGSTFTPTNPGFGTSLNSGMTNQHPISNAMTISSSNQLKYSKIESFPDDIKKEILNIETTISNNELLLSTTNKHISNLYEDFLSLKVEGKKLFNCIKLIYTKYQNMSALINSLRNEVKVQKDYLDENIRNFQTMNRYPNDKINIPSGYFMRLTDEIYEKINFFRSELIELENLIESYCTENESINENITMHEKLETFIFELSSALKMIICENIAISEKTKVLKNAFFQFMKINYNTKEQELEFKLKQYLEKNDHL